MMIYKYFLALSCLLGLVCKTGTAQNSLTGDGFGGRLWYTPTNYTVGSYSAFSLCYGNPCDSSTNQLYGWGNNGYEELGYSSLTLMGSNVPIPIPNLMGVKYYSTGYNMGAIKLNGTGWVWGNGLFSTPTQVLSNAKFVDGSMNFVSFVKNDGTVWSIGDNSLGQFGNGTTTSNYTSPVQMLNVNNAVRVANSYTAQIILLANGNVMSVGFGFLGELGQGTSTTQITAPALISGLSNIVDIKATSYATVALDANGDVYAWGFGYSIGDGDITNEFVPKKINSLSNIVAISGCADGGHFLALDANKNCYAWGMDAASGVGTMVGNYALSPTLVATDVIDIMAGETFS